MVDLSTAHVNYSQDRLETGGDALLTVVIPTVDGREDHYERCFNAYANRTPKDWPIEIITVRNENSCGNAWQKGAEVATGRLLHFTADDLEPLDGWWIGAAHAIENEQFPAPRLLNADGSLYGAYPWGDPPDGTPVAMSVIPFFRRDLWSKIGPMLPDHHYYTDNWVSWRAERAGLRITYQGSSYAFVHHWAQAKRGAGMSSEARMNHDREIYEAAIVRVEAGNQP